MVLYAYAIGRANMQIDMKRLSWFVVVQAERFVTRVGDTNQRSQRNAHSVSQVPGPSTRHLRVPVLELHQKERRS